jgi:hypothetical protein
MKKISFVVNRDYQQNKIFDLSDKILNRDNCLSPYFELRERFKEKGYDLQTSDILSPEEADVVLYNEMPKKSPSLNEVKKSYLMLFETSIIRADNWDIGKHQFFKKIFTWHDTFVDGLKYIKFNFPNQIKSTAPGLVGRDKLLTSISGNKTSSHSLELYSKRLETIRWFEKHHPQDLDYYGIGWDYSFDVWWQKFFRKLHILKFFPKHKSLSCKGRIEEKLVTLRKYKFALCYENGRDIDGYITEKIFDCFFAGTIPIYWGANNIQDYIPENCFIDKRNYKLDQEVYNLIKNMKDLEIIAYQSNIESFLKSEKITPFSNDIFVSTIVENIINE